MGLHSYRVCFIIQIAVTVCESTRPLNISLYTSKHTWNEANDVCLKHNKSLLSLKSLSKNNITIEIAKKWTSSSHLVGNFWISLIETNYGEFEWSDCESLGYSYWDSSGPGGNGMCVGFNITNNKWQKFSCNEEFQVICEEEAVVDKCWFEEFVEVRFSETDGLIGYGGHSLQTCQNSCLGLGSETTECIMISFENSTGVCRLLEQSVVRLEGPPPSFPSPTFVTYVKRCYDYYVSGDEIVSLNKLSYPETNCTDFINVTTTLSSDSTEYIRSSIIDYSSVVTANQTSMVTESMPLSTLVTGVDSTLASEAYYSLTSEDISMSVSDVNPSSTSIDIPSSTYDGIPTSMSTQTSLSESTTFTATSTPMSALYPKPDLPSSILCPCKCFSMVELDNSTKEAEIIAEIKKELIVNTTTLSSFKRKLYSAEDSRSSAEVVGSIAIGFLGSLLLIVAMLDFHHFLRGVQNIFVKYKNRGICIAYQPKCVENNMT